MQFPYVRKHFPTSLPSVLPFFVLWMVLINITAFVFLYVAMVALDLRPELYNNQRLALVPFPVISAHGNFIPGYVIIGGVLVIGYPWVLAAGRGVVKIFSRRNRSHTGTPSLEI